jgi:hypothetical protein
MSIINAMERYSKQKVLYSFLFGLLSLAVVTLFIFFPHDAYSAQATLTWAASTTNVDGTPLTNLAGYKIYYGTASANYSQNVDVGNVTTSTVSSLNDGLTYFFAVTSYDSSGVESAYSNEVSKTIQGTQQYSLSIIKSGTGSGTVTSSSGGINCGAVCTATYKSGSVVTLTAAPAGNSTFSSWSGGGCTGSGKCSLSVNANIAVTAKFTANTYTINTTSGAGGSISPSGSVTVNKGANQAFTITPSTGYSIAAVTVDGTAVGAVSTYTFSNVMTNHTIAASFAISKTSLASVNPTSYTFKNTWVGYSSYKSFQIKNTGKAKLSILKVELAGADASMFSATLTGTKMLWPSSSFYQQVKFKPTSKGVKNAVLRITSNDPTTPVVTIPLSGTGI